MEHWPEPAIDFATQPLFLARVPKQFGIERLRQPIGVLQQQLTEGLRSAEERRQDARLFRRGLPQRPGCAGGFELIEAVLRPLRVGAGLDDLLPLELSHG